MNKKHSYTKIGRSSKRLWITFLLFSFFAIGFLQAANKMFAQTTVTAVFKDATLNEVLWEIQRQTDFTFVYSTNDVKQVRVQHLNVTNEKIANVLEKCLKNSGLTYAVHDGVIAIKPSARPKEVETPQQKIKINGTVVDETGEGVIGANILVKGTTNGATTDLEGRFSLEVDHAQVTLIVSYIGYVKREIKVASGKSIKIILVPDNNLMEEVVVTGYGTFKKSAYAGSASTVKTGELKDIPVVSFSGMLEGNAPGVQVSSSSGQPGAASSIRIRGMGSFNASNSPLYVIDGIPVQSGSVASTSSDSGFDIMSTLNNSDIENITVIKDAAAASLYGSRAANGVILITTKKGRSGKAQISLKADWGSSDLARDYRPVMGGQERRDFIYDGLKLYQQRKLTGKNPSISDEELNAEMKKYADGKIDKYAPIPWCGFTDWNNELFQKGHHSTYDVSLSGGSDKFKYYSSLSYIKQDGIVQGSGLERITGRVNVDLNATDKLTVGAKILFSNVNQSIYDEGFTYTSPFYSSRNWATPSDPVYNEDGSWNRSFIRKGNDRNPRLSAEYDYKHEKMLRAFNTLYAEYEFIKDLKFKTTFSYDYTTVKGEQWADPRTSNGEDENGEVTKRMSEFKKMVWNNSLTYLKTINQVHHIDVLAGYEIDDTYSDYLSGEAYNYATSDKHAISNGMKTVSVGGADSRYRLVSYLSRLNYDYYNRYYLGASFRVDGSSRLHRDNRWGTFWSVSGAWRAIEEEFMSPMKDWLSDLRLRASYGVNGTLPSDLFGYMGLSSVNGGYLEQPGIQISQIANPELKWETNYNMNFGLDFGFWDRLNFTIEYYTRTTKNLLMDCPVSMTTGFSSYLMNIGEVKNEGVELTINSSNIKGKDFTWNTMLNLGHNANKVVKLDGEQTQIISGSQIHKIGSSYRTFYVQEFAGINPETGAPQFYTNTLDEQGNYVKELTESSKNAQFIPYKHAEATLNGGLSNSLKYKWFDLNFLFSYQLGGYAYDTWAQKTEHGGYDSYSNIPTYYRDSWKKPGDQTDIEVYMPGKSSSVSMHKISSSRRIHSTDYLRLKNFTFGFTLPKEWTRKAGIGYVRLYAAASNLLTWAAYDNFDPEGVSAGEATRNTPPLKTITFGLNLNF
ncbi:MAG: TonB-dependent receptor [Bacteroides sp.]